MKKMKQLLSMLLVCCIVAGLLPGTAWAANSDFTIENGVLTKYNGPGGIVSIPSSVTSIGMSAFEDCKGLTSVTIPEGVTSIGDWAFQNCTGLTSITIPSSVTNIGWSAFKDCSGLTNVIVPSSVTNIGGGGFGAFDGCSGLTSAGPIGGGYSYEFGWTNVIPDGAFDGCSGLTSVIIPDSVTSIGEWAFAYCSGLKGVTIPNGVTNIGYAAFASSGLINVTIPDSVTNIEDGVFSGSVITNVTIPSSVTSIGDGAFSGTCLTRVTIPSSVISIGKEAFYECKDLTRVIMERGVKTIGWRAFQNCSNLNLVEFPDSIVSIGDYAFSGTGFTSLVFPEGLTTVGSCAFVYCDNLTSVTIPSSVTYIEQQAFRHNMSLTSVTIPSSVTGIAYNAFNDCYSLTDVYYSGSEEQWKRISIADYNDPLISATIHYNSTGLDIPTGEYSSVYFLSNWDAVTRSVKFGDSKVATIDKYTVADDVDVSGIDSLLNKYALVTTKQGQDYWDNIVTDIQPVDSKIGTLSAIDKTAFVIDGITYPSSEETELVWGLYKGKDVLYHLFEGRVISMSPLEERHGKLGAWDEGKGRLTIGQKDYPTNALTDFSFMDNIRDYFEKDVRFLVVESSDYCPFLGIIGLYEPDKDLNNFDADIYHAKWLSQDTASATMLNLRTPSDILSEKLTDSGMSAATTMWKSLEMVFDTLDDPTSIKDFVFEKKDMYSAIILETLEASVSYDVIDSFFEDYYKQLGTMFQRVSKAIQEQHKVDITKPGEFKQMTDQQKADLQKETKKWFDEELPGLTVANSIFDGISMGFDGIGSLEDYGERIASTLLLANLNESIKTVLRQAYQSSKATHNLDLQLALNECVKIMDSSTEELCERLVVGEITVLGEKGLKYLIKEQWSEVTKTLEKSAPEVAILKSIYKIEKLVCDTLTHAGSATEQYLKLLATLDIENLMNGVYNDMRQTFLDGKTSEQAQAYLEAMRLVFRFRNIDCKAAINYVDVMFAKELDIFDDALLTLIANSLFKTKEVEAQALKKSIQSIQNDYSTSYSCAEQNWIEMLEDDFPGTGLYERYLKIYEKKNDIAAVKEYVAACPVNVYVYNQQNNVVASIVSSCVECLDDNIMIALIGDQKVIRVYDGADYRIEYVGYDDGDMDITITEFDKGEDIIRTINYYDVPLTDGKTYSIDATDETLRPYNLVDKTENSAVSHDYDSMNTSTPRSIKVISGTLLQNDELSTETTSSKGETLQLNAYVPEGYEFICWESSVDNATIANISDVNTTMVMPDADIIVTAIMRKVQGTGGVHTITFDPDGGNLSESTIQTGAEGKLLSIPTPTRNGYTFKGWYMSDGTKITIDTIFATNVTVKAKWEEDKTGGDSQPPSNPGSATNKPGDTTPNPGNSSYNPGGIYVPPSHSINTPSVTGGKVSVNPASASSGSTVTITTTPDSGYELAFLTVSDANGKAIDLTNNGNGQYSFKMPNGRVSLDVEFSPINSDVTWNNPFVDVSPDAWYYEAIKFVNQNGLMNGVGNGLFAPDTHLSRAMLAEILYNKEGRPVMSGGTSAFPDVSLEEWYSDAVSWAFGQGIIKGYDNGLFGPDDDITREQLAVILYRYAGSPVPPNLLLDFTDAYKVSDWAQDAIRWAVDQGILNGKGNGILDPTGKATRAEAAQMLKNYFGK